MANCKDCSKYQDCVFVENGDVDVYAENKENNCEQFDRLTDCLGRENDLSRM